MVIGVQLPEEFVRVLKTMDPVSSEADQQTTLLARGDVGQPRARDASTRAPPHQRPVITARFADWSSFPRHFAAKSITQSRPTVFGGFMQARKNLTTWGAAVLFATALGVAHAQQVKPRDSTADEQARMPTPAVEPPPKPF